jgi:hypothetical protein
MSVPVKPPVPAIFPPSDEEVADDVGPRDQVAQFQGDRSSGSGSGPSGAAQPVPPGREGAGSGGGRE